MSTCPHNAGFFGLIYNLSYCLQEACVVISQITQVILRHSKHRSLHNQT